MAAMTRDGEGWERMKLPRMRVRVNQVDRKKKTGEETVGLVNGRYYGDNRDDGDQATLFLPMAILSP